MDDQMFIDAMPARVRRRLAAAIVPIPPDNLVFQLREEGLDYDGLRCCISEYPREYAKLRKQERDK